MLRLGTVFIVFKNCFWQLDPCESHSLSEKSSIVSFPLPFASLSSKKYSCGGKGKKASYLWDISLFVHKAFHPQLQDHLLQAELCHPTKKVKAPQNGTSLEKGWLQMQLLKRCRGEQDKPLFQHDQSPCKRTWWGLDGLCSGRTQTFPRPRVPSPSPQ